MAFGMDSRTLEIVLKATDQASSVVDSASTKIGSKLDQLKSKLDGMSASQKIGVAGAALEAGGLLAAKAWDKAADAAVDYGTQVLTIQRMTGDAADTSSKLAAIFSRFGIDATTGGKLLKTLDTQIIAKDTSKAATALHQMGIETVDASGKARDSIAVLADVAGYYANATDKTTATALAAKVLGKNWQTLLPVLSAGRQGILDMTDAAKANGLVLGQDAVDAVAKYSAAAKDAKEAQEGMKIQFGLAVLPIKTFIEQGIAKLFGWYNKLSPETKKLVTYVGLAATAFALIAGPLMILISMLPMMAAGIGIVAGAMDALVMGPAGLVIAIIVAIIAIVVLCIKYHKQLGEALKVVWHAIAAFFTAIWDGIKAAFWAFVNFLKKNWEWVLAGMLALATGGLSLIVVAFVKYKKQIIDAFKDAGKWLYDVGKKIIDGLWNGLKDMFKAVEDWGVGLYHKITGWIHFSGGPLYDVGRKVMVGFAAGLGDHLGLARAVVAGSMSGIAPQLGFAGSYGGGGSFSNASGGVTVKHEHHIYLDGVELNRALGKTIIHSTRSGAR